MNRHVSWITALLFMGMMLVLVAVMATHARAAAAFVPPSPPICMIDQSYGNFHTATTAAGDTVAMLWCDSQRGLEYWGAAGSVATAASGVACLPPNALWSIAWLQAAWNACINRPLTTDQAATLHTLVLRWLPRLYTVSTANQNVYTVNVVDGTQGPQLVIGGIGMQVAPGIGCDAGGRLQRAGARFAGIGARLSTNGMLLPTNVFALCDIFYPPVDGWAP